MLVLVVVFVGFLFFFFFPLFSFDFCPDMKQYSADLCTVWTCSSPTRWHRKKKKKPQQTQTFGKRCAAVGRARSSNLKPRAFPPKLQVSLEQRPGAASLSSNSRIHQHYSEISCSNEIFFFFVDCWKKGGERGAPPAFTQTCESKPRCLGTGKPPALGVGPHPISSHPHPSTWGRTKPAAEASPSPPQEPSPPQWLLMHFHCPSH